jgi:hypothetical protein
LEIWTWNFILFHLICYKLQFLSLLMNFSQKKKLAYELWWCPFTSEIMYLVYLLICYYCMDKLIRVLYALSQISTCMENNCLKHLKILFFCFRFIVFFLFCAIENVWCFLFNKLMDFLLLLSCTMYYSHFNSNRC